MNSNVYRNTTMPDILHKLKSTFGAEKGDNIFTDACEKLSYELSRIDSKGDKAISRHLSMGILPCFSCYSSMLNNHITQTQAYDLIQDIVFSRKDWPEYGAHVQLDALLSIQAHGKADDSHGLSKRRLDNRLARTDATQNKL